MKKNICRKVLVVWIILLFVGANIVIGNENNKLKNTKKNISTLDDELDQQQTYCSGATELGYSDGYNFALAQSFTPQKTILTRIFLYISRVGQPYPFELAIRKELNEENLTTVSINYNYIPIDDEEWVEFNFNDISVVPGETYFMIMSTQSKFMTIYGVGLGNNNPYPNGTFWIGDWQDWNDDVNFDCCFKTYGYGKPPNKPVKPSGSTNGKVNFEYIYISSTTDPDGDQLYYNWSWGHGIYSGWIGPVNSGVIIETNHTWNKKGIYKIKVKVKDVNGAESEWSDSLSVIIPRNRVSYGSLFMRFLKQFPILKRFLFLP